MSFFNELKRRNVFKVAIAHIVMADLAEGSDAVKTKGRYMNVARNMVGIWLYMAGQAIQDIARGGNFGKLVVTI